MSLELKKKLAQVEDDLRSLRDERAGKVTKLEEAKAAFGKLEKWDASSPEYDAAREARRAVGELDDQVAAEQVKQVELLKLLGQDQPARQNGNGVTPNGNGSDPTGAWTSEALFSEEIRATLSHLSGSKARFGSIQLGQVVDRDRLAADVTGTDSMRRGTYVGVVPQIFRPLRVLDLIPIGRTDGNLVPYTQEGGNFLAAETAEGLAKPEDGITYTDANAPVQTIAAWQKIRKQALSDFAAIQSIIDTRLRYSVMRRLETQILAGNGSGSNLTGILITAGIGSVAFSSTVPFAELILTGITNVYLAGAEASGIVLNPIDWQTALTQKAQFTASAGVTGGSGEYVGGGPFQVTPQIMWGVPLVPSPALAQGTGLVADWALGATLLIREGVQVLLSDSDQDDFIKNRVTMLGEMRAALPVWRPVAFQKIALA